MAINIGSKITGAFSNISQGVTSNITNLRFNNQGAGTELANNSNLGVTHYNSTLDNDVVEVRFPRDIPIDRPMIRFTAFERKSAEKGHPKPYRIYLPAPSNISFNDQASYQNFNMGVIGMAGDKLGKYIDTGFREGAGAAFGQLREDIQGFNSNLQSAFAANALEIAALIATEFAPASMAGSASRITGTVANPSTTSAFEGNSTRGFGFSFKMVADSKEESDAIRDIHSIFRRYMYGKKSLQGLQLEYPAIWSIDFINLRTPENRLMYIPKIASCYCRDLSTTFNANSDVYFENNAPLEVDIAVQFQETRALTYDDIILMEEDEATNSLQGHTFGDTYANRITPISEKTEEYIDSLGRDRPVVQDSDDPNDPDFRGSIRV